MNLEANLCYEIAQPMSVTAQTDCGRVAISLKGNESHTWSITHAAPFKRQIAHTADTINTQYEALDWFRKETHQLTRYLSVTPFFKVHLDVNNTPCFIEAFYNTDPKDGQPTNKIFGVDKGNNGVWHYSGNYKHLEPIPSKAFTRCSIQKYALGMLADLIGHTKNEKPIFWHNHISATYDHFGKLTKMIGFATSKKADGEIVENPAVIATPVKGESTWNIERFNFTDAKLQKHAGTVDQMVLLASNSI